MSAASSTPESETQRAQTDNGGGPADLEKGHFDANKGEGSSEEEGAVKDGAGVKTNTEKGGKAEASAVAPGVMFGWVKTALRSHRIIKTLIRCLLVVAACVVLLVDKDTMNNIGQTAFFPGILVMMLPPSLAISVFLIASVMLLFGMLLGWAWGVAAMAAAQSVRSQALLAAREAAAKNALVAGISPTRQLQIDTFHGLFLDPRSSAVYGAFFFIGTFAMGALRAKVPKLQVVGIFGTIVMDVMCSTGPLLPSPQYLVAKMFLIPSCYYVAVALLSIVLVFPETANHMWLTTLDQAFFEPALSILTLQSAALAERPSDHKAWAAVAAKVTAARVGLGAGLAALAGQIGLVDLEVSRGHLGPRDLKRLAPEVRALGFRISALLSFQATVMMRQEEDAQAAAALNRDAAAKTNTDGSFDPARDSRFAHRRRNVHEREVRHGHTLDALTPILASSSAPLRTAGEDALQALRAWFVECNRGRWSTLLRGKNAVEVEARQGALAGTREKLGRALEEFRSVERAKLIKPYERFFDPETGKLLNGRGVDRVGKLSADPDMFAVRSLFICFVFCDALDAFAARLHRLMGIVAELDLERQQPRFWLPLGLGSIGHKLLSKQDVGVVTQPLAMGTATDPTQFEDASTEAVDEEEEGIDSVEEKEAPAPARRNPDALPPTSGLGRFFVTLGGALRFFKTPEGIFALRHAVVSLALWIPAVVPRTAWFYYSNKGLWALIMSQTGLATFAGEQLFGLATRLAGTLLGLLNGLVVWYIAAPGKGGTGNPYAITVVTTVFVAPFMLGRLAAPPAMMMFWTMIGVTTLFVVGYSYLDEHFLMVSNTGVGIVVGWKRALLVIVGFTAGGIVMMFPRPTSARTLVRRTLAATLKELGSIFGQEVEAFLAEEARARGGHYEKETIDWVDQTTTTEQPKLTPKERRIRRVAARVLVVFERLQGLTPSLKLGRWEPQAQGRWPHEQYELLHAKESKLITALALLAGAFSKLDPKWCSLLVHRTPFLNPNLLSDVFATIDIHSNALSDGHPLPASLPCLRERLMYHEALIRSMDWQRPGEPAKKVDIPEDTDSETEISEFVAGKVEGASIGFEELSLSVLMDEQLPTHSTAVIALGSVLTLIDEIGVIVRELCGQTTFRGFDTLHREFLGREEAALGMLPPQAR
ncbi:hypothetical protein C8F04DRAFT_1123608 [Mycena alexandri]|uniref:ER transporter 6TM N-terminal domain-containing protein n=1 Tax=Mycena alexandri TaxID=1745969 RepID=A0AAD6SFJ9_9AGAR|nr:hypothetical protein C8F04DRAFT_1123608 [Mycena alexandri]